MRRNQVREYPFPRHPHFGKCGWCKWCGTKIPDVIDGKRSTQRLWHPACWDEFQLHSRASIQFDFVANRDGERCAWPGCGDTPMKWLRGEAMATVVGSWASDSDWAKELWTADELGPCPPSYDFVRGMVINRDGWMLRGGQCSIERVSALELDHRVPLWSVVALPPEERRWYFGPGNLWLLCPRHHKEKTRREAAQRAAEKRIAKAQLGLI